ncbi:MAG: acetyl ornithine aminotransferase family protein [Candidatus Eisenbacteria bacterium]|nr:acetyl ornithine aminotransferase family protein [Candidatus Eisenbacteria bacterium]
MTGSTPLIKGRLPGPKARAWLARDHRSLSPSYTRSYPMVVERGKGAWLWDVDGNKFLDMNAGIAVCATGHAHPKVVRAIQQQAAKFLHMSGTDFYYGPEIQVAERLAKLSPTRGPARTYLCNSGTEAVESAIKLARFKTRRPLLLGFLGAFHGRTLGALALTASKATQRRGFAPLTPQAVHVPYANCRRCVFNLKFPACQFACVKFIEQEIFRTVLPPEDCAAMVVEPIQGEGGYVVPPPGYFQELRKLCDKYGILLVLDEVQAGMGRTGKWWAIQHWGVKPDIITVAKGIASGMPLAAMLAPASLMDWPPGSHGNTFGGNPVCCAASLATLDLIEGGLMKNAERRGVELMEGLKELEARHRSIGWVQGRGLMVGVEIVKDRSGMAGDGKMRDELVERAFRKGMLLLGSGPNSIRFAPPLVITRDEIATSLSIFDEVLTAAEKKKTR